MNTVSDQDYLNNNPSLRTRCEIWTRVMGYHRPVDQWNPGKQSEHADRKYMVEPTYGLDLAA